MTHSPRPTTTAPRIQRHRLPGGFEQAFHTLDVRQTAERLLAGAPEGFAERLDLEMGHAHLRPAGVLAALLAEQAWYALAASLAEDLPEIQARAALSRRLARAWAPVDPQGAPAVRAFGVFLEPSVTLS